MGATFADQPLGAGVVIEVARAAADRTALLVVLRELPRGGSSEAMAPGVYALDEDDAELVPLQPTADLAWRVISDARPLAFASALLLLPQGSTTSHAIRQARAVAEGLGAGSARVHGLASGLLLGVRPSQQQVQLQRAGAWRCFGPALGPVPSDCRTPLERFAYLAGPIQLGPTKIYATGRAAEPRLAVRKADAEAWERQGWARLGPTTQGTMADVHGALDPSGFVAYSAAQHAAPGFPFLPFSSRRPYLWTAGVNVHSGNAVALPAECVHAASALPAAHALPSHTWSTTSGVAAWADAEGALCRATLELLERDAFLRCWLGGTAPARWRDSSLPAAARAPLARLRASGHFVTVVPLCSDPVCIVSVFVRGTAPAFSAITAAAAFDMAEALDRALDEAEGRAAHAQNSRRRSARGSALRGVEESMHLYRTRRLQRQADFYAAGPEHAFRSAHRAACVDWPMLRGWFASRGVPLLAFDLTPPGASVDQGRTALRVVRAMAPGLLPIWFRCGHEPAGLAAFQQALAGGLRTRADSLHLLHPLA